MGTAVEGTPQVREEPKDWSICSSIVIVDWLTILGLVLSDKTTTKSSLV